VRINGRTPDEYAFKPAAATITYTMAYEEEQARLYGGLSITEWDNLPGNQFWINPDTGGRCKSDMIMLYRMSNWIPAAANDAAARQMERESRMRNHR